MTTKEQQLASQARKAREAVARRDALIAELSADGLSLRAIAALAGLSHTAIRKIISRDVALIVSVDRVDADVAPTEVAPQATPASLTQPTIAKVAPL